MPRTDRAWHSRERRVTATGGRPKHTVEELTGLAASRRWVGPTISHSDMAKELHDGGGW